MRWLQLHILYNVKEYGPRLTWKVDAVVRLKSGIFEFFVGQVLHGYEHAGLVIAEELEAEFIRHGSFLRSVPSQPVHGEVSARNRSAQERGRLDEQLGGELGRRRLPLRERGENAHLALHHAVWLP